MGLREATNAAEAVRVDDFKHPHCLVAYMYTRGCYAVIVLRDDSTVVLVDEAAVSLYRMNHRREEWKQGDGT